ncbi:MAG TPA: ABC transporter substrate-binding protein, partial [Albitalea sp.]|nr:ABC transporter substrate-binding protein [Albitalea sp.]
MTAALAWCGAAHAQSALPLGFFASLDAQHPFWTSVRGFEEAVGRDLNIESRWRFADSDQYLGYEQIRRELESAQPVRGAMVTGFKAQGGRFLELIERAKVPTITFVGFDLNSFGKPRQSNPYWIGAITSNEEDVGYQLARLLLEEAQRLGLHGHDGKLHLIGVSGDLSSLLRKAREAGLQRAVSERAGTVVLDQVVPTADWSEREGHAKALGLLHRYPDARIVWSANDAIALGVVKAVREMGKIPGRDVLTGGVDWTPEALHLVARGEMVCSIGGLGFQAGWATILLHDYLNGHDFADDVGVLIKLPTATLTQRNAGAYLRAYGEGAWNGVDFTALSKARNPRLKRYD